VSALARPPASRTRCPWAGAKDALYARYHDTEWGVPEHDDRALFEKLILDGAQAGLSWSTILNKRGNYRRAFDGFVVAKVARFGERRIAALLADEGIVRNRAKVRSAVTNAQSFLAMQKEFGSFDAWLWGHVGGRPVQNAWESQSQIPATTPLSDAVSKELRARGFKFVGSTIVYAYLQAIGMVNDHIVSCFRHEPVRRMGERRPRSRR